MSSNYQNVQNYQNLPNEYYNMQVASNNYGSMISRCYSDHIKIGDNDKDVAVHMGDGWCTFPDLDNFDSDKLLRALTLKEKDSHDSIWDPNAHYTDTSQSKQLSISALRQLEALFNLSQLLFGLSRAETVNYTFRDLQLRRHPHSFKKSGFKQLNMDGRIDFYAVFEQLVYKIIEEGGLDVTLLIYKNPQLPMVRQKCLDLISNVTTVPQIACKIMHQQSWFLDHLLIMVRDGDIISDKIPALSVLIRLLKVMLTERMLSSYMKLVDMQYIDCLVDIFEYPKFNDWSEFLPFFIKFEFITMQSLTVILGDNEYSQFWSDKAKTRLLNYCMIVLVKAAGGHSASSNTNQDSIEKINHIFYAEKHSHKHSLAHTIMTVTELFRNDENMREFYRGHRSFKQLIVELYKKYGAKSQYIKSDPGISYALNHLMRILYIKTNNQTNGLENNPKKPSNDHLVVNSLNQLVASTSGNMQPALGILSGASTRTCSNLLCENEETKFKPFKECSRCGKVAYCSSKCRKLCIGYHRKTECTGNNNGAVTATSSSSSCISRSNTNANNYENIAPITRHKLAMHVKSNNYENLVINNELPPQPAKSSSVNRRNSENLYSHQMKQLHQYEEQDDIYYEQQQQQHPKSGTLNTYHQSISRSKRLSKYASLNENHRRNSLNLAAQQNGSNEVQKFLNHPQRIKSQLHQQSQQQKLQTPIIANKQTSISHAKHANSMKEIKTSFANTAGLNSNPYRRSSYLNNESIKPKIMSANQHTMNETNSIHFVRPLKTSTALCLSDLTRKQQSMQQPIDPSQLLQATQQKSKLSSDTSSASADSTVSSTATTIAPIIKKQKTNNGNYYSPKPGKENFNDKPNPSKGNNLNTSNHKRRHSATASVLTTLTTTKTTTKTTLTKTKTKQFEKESVMRSSSSSRMPDNDQHSDENNAAHDRQNDFFYYGKTTESHHETAENAKMTSHFVYEKNSSAKNNPQEDKNSSQSDQEDNCEDFSSSSLSSSTSSADSSSSTDTDSDASFKEEEQVDVIEVNKIFTNANQPNEQNNCNVDDYDEVEGERQWVASEASNLQSNRQTKVKQNLYIKNRRSSNQFAHKLNQIQKSNSDNDELEENTYTSIHEINQGNFVDERDRISQIKVVKEFEKTLEYVNNMTTSNFTQITTSNRQLVNNSSNDPMSANSCLNPPPQISLASLCYEDNNYQSKENNTMFSLASSNVKNKHSIGDASSNDDSDSTRDETDLVDREPKAKDRPNKRTGSNRLGNYNFLINNNLESPMATSNIYENTKSMKNIQKDNTDILLDNNYSSTIKSEYATFKAPLNLDNKPSNKLPLSLQPITNTINNNTDPKQAAFLRPNKFSELKVFNHLNEQAARDTAVPYPSKLANEAKANPQLNALLAELPKNSTPIFTDSNTANILLNKRKQLLNAKLDLTIAPPNTASLPSTNSITQFNSNNNQLGAKSQTKFSSNSLSKLQQNIEEIDHYDEADELVIGGKTRTAKDSGALNVSKLHSIETATSTNLVPVTETEMPKEVKKCLKDKSKCLIS